MKLAKKFVPILLIYIFTLSLSNGFFYLFIPQAQAQMPGIEVSPSSIQLDLAKDHPQTILTYINHTNQPILLTFSTSDVKELEGSYTLTYLNDQSAQNFKYGLSSWIEFSNNSLLLNPGETSSITIFINAAKLSPGGHYGSVLASIQSAQGGGNVTIKSVLASLVFVRTHTGKEYEKGEITSFLPEQNFFDFPQHFLLRFTNKGDTYVTPYGIVKVYDMWGNYVGKGVLNTGSLLVLPETLRRMEIPTQTFGGILLPGVYHATFSMHFGQTNQQLSSVTTFFSFGTLPILPLFIVLLILLNVGLFLRKHYKARKEV